MPGSTNTADEYDFVDHDETALSPETIAQIREWLQPTDYLAESGEFRRHLASQAPGTGLWICETDEYRKWHDSPDHGSLWIKGVPGAGKSVTAASIIQHLRTTEDCPVLFFFFRNIVAANFSHRALIQDWLAQLLPYSPKLQFALEPRLKTNLEEATDNELIELFLDGLSCVPKVYCVGDALDEMTRDNRPFLDKLNSLATYRPRSLKLLITSRPKQHLQSALRDSSIVHISLQQQLVDADIMSYLHHRFDQATKTEGQNAMKQNVIDMVARRSEGLFLYAKLTMDQVETSLLADEPVDVHSLEESLPVGLEQTYDSVLARQRRDHGVSVDLQLMVLEAVTHSSRPLRLHELASLIECICPDIAAPQTFKTLVANSCGSLVEILEDETLQVIHHSFTEFLRGDTRSPGSDVSSTSFPIIDSSKSHRRMAINCLQYLQSGALLLGHEVEFGEDEDDDDGDQESKGDDSFNYREARLAHPFLRYAVENWSYHASRHDVNDQEFFAAVAEFFSPESLSFCRWLTLQWGSPGEGSGKVPTPLHVAAFSGMSELVSKLIQEGADVAESDSQNRLPIHWAASNGHSRVVSLLLQHGSDPNPEDCRGLKPIHLAALKNHASAVSVLLEAGVAPETIKARENHNRSRLKGGETITRGECAILYATRAGHTETIKAMIPFCKGKVLEQLLCQSCRFGRTDAALAILKESDVAADAMFEGATALYFACDAANPQCVEALLKRGADPQKTSQWAPRRSRNGGMWMKYGEEAPIHKVMEWWGDDTSSAREKIVAILANAGADVDQLNDRMNTALLMAAGALGNGNRSGRVRVQALRALLAAGADVARTTSDGSTALHLMLEHGPDLEATKLLLAHGSYPNQKGKDGGTALHYLFNRRSHHAATAEVAAYLLEQGADPSITDSHGDTPIYLAMNNGLDVFQILFARCTDESIKRRCWFQLACHSRNEPFAKFVELFLAGGMKIDTRDLQGRTLYHHCIRNDGKLEILRKHGASNDLIDNRGNNILHMACGGSDKAQMRLKQFIKETDLDPLATNTQGNTLLHIVANSSHVEDRTLVPWLVSLGISVDATNMKGSTPLHLYMRPKPSNCDSRPSDTERVTFVEDIIRVARPNLEIRDNDGFTPLHLAAMSNSDDLARMVKAGADLAALTTDKQNVLHLTCRTRQYFTILYILDNLKFIDINQRDIYGRTPLHYACSAGEPEIVALMLRQGANVHIADSDGRLPIHACAEFKMEQLVWDALEQGHAWLRGPPRDPFRPRAEIDFRYNHNHWQRHSNGITSMRSRKSFFHEVATMLKLLLEHGADAGAADKKGCSALDLALWNGCAEFVEVFAKDEQLFVKATRSLADTTDASKYADELRDCIRGQMALMRPTSAFNTTRQDKEALDQVRKRPHIYLELLTCDDAAALINEAFAVDPINHSHYTALCEIIKSRHLELLEKISKLVLYYSSYDAVRDKLERDRSRRGCYKSEVVTPLRLACQSSEPNLLLLRVLVEKIKVDVNAQIAMVSENHMYHPKAQVLAGGTALHLLASGDGPWQAEAMSYLLGKGGSVDIRDEEGQTPLHIAPLGKCIGYSVKRTSGPWSVRIVETLLAHGADPNSLDSKGLTPLHRASSAPNAMRALLKAGADVTVGAVNPLFHAIREFNLPALEILLDHGISVDSVNEQMLSRSVNYHLTEPRKVYALLFAAFGSPSDNISIMQKLPLFQVLLARGADLYVPLNDKETLVHFLFTWAEHVIVDALLDQSNVSRIDFSRRDQCGRTVLHASCDWRESLPSFSRDTRAPVKHVGIPLRILDNGADATLVDNEGKTALHRLLGNIGTPDEVLLDFINRAEVAPTLFVPDSQGFLPFHYALRILRPPVCELLLSKGADILQPDPDRRTVLHYVASQCLMRERKRTFGSYLTTTLGDIYFDECLALWRRFIAAGGSINAADKQGDTPLHAYLLAAERHLEYNAKVEPDYCCHVESFDRLFAPPAAPEQGISPNNRAVVDLLAVTKAGETALHAVAARKKMEAVQQPEHDRVLFKFLVSKGLDPLREDARGRSALDVASVYEKDEILGLFGRN